MKSFLSIVALTLSVALGVTDAQGATNSRYEVVRIFPTGVFPDDVNNIQAAVDDFGARGVNGTLILKSHNRHRIATAFNFGTDPDPTLRGSVVLGADYVGAVEFRGEASKYGQTTIVGGSPPINVTRRDKLTVRNIRFRRAFRNAIRVRAAAGLVIEDNVFSETEGLVADLFPITVVITIAGQSFGAEEDITGDIVLRRNVIDGASALFSDGISLLSTNARIYVANNHISGVNVAFRNEIYRRPAYITGNDFMGAVTDFGFFSAGIEIGCGLGPEARATIRGNYIAAEDPEAIGFAVGISVFGGDLAAWSSDVPDADCPFRKSSIVGNDIVVSNGFDAIEFYAFAASRGRILDNVIARNSIRGSAINGIILENFDFLGTSPDVEISKNRIVDNELAGLSVEEADVFLGESTTGNFVVIKEDDIVADFGTNNRIIRR